MADKKISELDAIGALTGSNPIFPLVQGGNTLQINASALAVYTSQWSATTASFNTFVSTQNAVNLGIAIATGSFNQFTASLDATYATDEQLLQLYQATASIQSATASINTSITSLNSFSSSIQTEVGNIEAYTASLKSAAIVSSSQQILNYNIFVTTSSLNIYTSSQDLVNLGISIVTGSLNTFTSSQDLVNLGISIVTGSLNEQTASQDLVNLGISEVTSSLNSYTSSNESWKDGVRGEVSGLEEYTASLKGAIEVSGQDVNVLGMITAQQFNVTYVSSSTLYQSGSTKFGDTSDDRHEFTGSVDITGSFLLAGRLSANFGTNNLYMGASSGQLAPVDTTSYNTSVGVNSFGNLSVGSYNTVVGAGALSSQQFNINRNVAIGTNVGSNVSDSSAGNILVGYEAGPSDSISINDTLYINNKVSNTPLIYGEFTDTPFVTINGGLNVTSSVDVSGSVKAFSLTGSLLSTNGVVSSSQQISNYYKFAETASANTFYGTQTFSGSTIFGNSLDDTHDFIGDTTISGSLFVSGTSVFGGDLIPQTPQGATLGTPEKPFRELYLQSGSISIESDTPGDPSAIISNNNGNLDISVGGMRLVQPGNSFIAETGSFSFISGSLTQVGDYIRIGDTIITGSVNVTNSITSSKVLTDSIVFDRTAGISVSEGELAWNDSDGTLELGLKYGDVVLQIGQEQHYTIRNATGTIIENGTAVYSTGVTTASGRIEAAPFTADGNVREIRFLGLATHDISNGVNGIVTHFGYVRGLDTRGTAETPISVGDENWQEGDILYAHPTVAGKLTNIPPKHKVYVAVVTTRHQNTGELFVRPFSYGHMDDIHDVAVNTGSLSTGDLFVYNSTSENWENTKILSGSYEVTGSLNIEGSGSLNGDTIVSSNTIQKIETITSASYAALSPPVSGTLYIII